MKIATLLGSPRTQGNSTTIAQRFQDTAVKLGATARTFELNKLTYRGCQGCCACKKNLDHCILNDDLTEVLQAVAGADLVVMASPVYYGDVTAQLKGFIDRTYSYLKPDYITNDSPSRLSRKKLVFVLTQGNGNELLFDDIFPRYSNFFTWLGFQEIHLVRACGIGPLTTDEAPASKLAEAEQLARYLIGGNKDILAF